MVIEMSEEFERRVEVVLQGLGYKTNHPRKGVDFIAEKGDVKVAVEVKEDTELKAVLGKALGQLLAAKTLNETSEEWLVLRPQKLFESPYFDAMRENGIKVFILNGQDLIEVKQFLSYKHDRKMRRGVDKDKLVRIWRALEGGEWLHIAEIARRTGIHECTVRWYLNRHLNQAIDEQNVLPAGIRLRLVRLKQGTDLVGYMKARKAIEEIKKSK
ncbi:MAG: restriction endonuclease [Candidatus Aenigmatarchaeota archaeon]